MKKILTAIICTFFITTITTTTFAQSVAINIDGSSADGSAALDVKATGKGVLIPRMALASRPSSPVTGLLIYQTDNTPGFYYYNGTAWTALQGGSVANATTQGNTFNGANQLVQLDGEYQMPEASAPYLYNLNASNLSSGTVSARRMPALAGDVNTSAGSTSTTITAGAITNSKLANSSVTVEKISTTSGTASETTYLRGDGTWSTPASGGGSGVAVDLIAVLNSSSTTTSLTASTTGVFPINFNNAVTSPSISGATWDGTNYKVGVTGNYMINVTMATNSANLSVWPYVLTSTGLAVYGSGGYNNNLSGYIGRATISTILPLTAGTTFKIMAQNGNNSTVATLATDGASRITVTKL